MGMLGKTTGTATLRGEYTKHKARAAERSSTVSAAGRDIADDYPAPGNRRRRGACRKSLEKFLVTYFPRAFAKPFCDDHRKVIGKLEKAIREGGLFAVAMPRGQGKTSIIERAVLWALLYRFRRFGCLIGATDGAATSMLEHIKRELLFNPILGCDFREVCYPLRCLQGSSRRCVGQLWRGQQTLIEWGADRLTFPTIPPSKVSGSTLSVRGLTGSIRGQSSTLASGEIIRPEIVIIDDPNTRESASSKLQTKQRLDIVMGDVLGMNGPNTTIAAVMPCTVIAPGDLADTLLNKEKFPEWQGERLPLVYSFPTNTALWNEYRDMRTADFRSGGDGAGATRFYAQHRQEMDVGVVVSWPERHNENELSAIQHAMNLKFRGEQSFMSEYQNSPELPQTSGDKVLSAVQIRGKVNGRQAGEVPTTASYLSAAVDCHDNLLFYAVCAWQPDFTGFLVEYGCYPRQGRRSVVTFARVAGGIGFAGLVLVLVAVVMVRTSG